MGPGKALALYLVLQSLPEEPTKAQCPLPFELELPQKGVWRQNSGPKPSAHHPCSEAGATQQKQVHSNRCHLQPRRQPLASHFIRRR